ncbi:MAG: acetoacetate--CoA ligase, partial [Gammaproteobacteria bacterium]|nr:acetoacetate--CoA ligase [Gammaproteobacteria bacterium]
KGELVCRHPFPSMPAYFWNDPDGRKYDEAYFADYPGWWHHGDYMAMTEQGGVIIYGRSDATLNIRGVRIGTAEIYRPLESVSWILNSIAVEQRSGSDAEISLFVEVEDGIELTSEREAEIRSLIRRQASPRHVPRRIDSVPAIPVTRNGKKAELAVKRIIEGDQVPNLDALANPECLDAFTKFARTES